MRNGEWELTITTADGPQLAYYNLRLQTDNTILVEGSSTDQQYAGAGWTNTTVNYGDTCGLVDTTTWCIYYDMAPNGLEAMTGQVRMVATTSLNNTYTFTFPATGRWLAH